MIERITTSVDLAANLRLEVSLAARTRDQQRGQRMRAETAADDPRGVIIDLESAAGRRPDRSDTEGYGKLIRFAQSGLGGDQTDDYASTAAEDQPALAASVLPRDWRAAQAASLYTRVGQIGAGGYSATVGTRLNAVA